MNKENVTHTCTHILQKLFSHRKEGNLAICDNMNKPKGCEISQTGKDKYSIISHIFGI